MWNSFLIKDVTVLVSWLNLFRDKTVSWVRVVNGVNKYVSETSEEILDTWKHWTCPYRETCSEGHSGGSLVDPTWQDNVLFPDDFAEYICHIGNDNEMLSIISIPSQSTGRRERGVWTVTLVTRHTVTRTVTAQIACTHTFITRHAWLKTMVDCVQKKSFIVLRTMSHALTHGTRGTCTPSSPSSLILAAVTSLTYCEDPTTYSKASHFSWTTFSHNMEGHVPKCVERYRELANKKTEQLYKVSCLCLKYHHFKKEELNQLDNLQKVCSQNNLMLVFGANWWTRLSLVCEQTGSSSHEMDRSLWQTLGSFDLLFSSHEWLTIWSC